MHFLNDRYQWISQNCSRVEQIIAYLIENYKSQPRLNEIAVYANLSKFHFQRSFKGSVGISPMQFLQLITLKHAKRFLSSSMSVLDTSLELGLSGPSRLHDLFVSFEGITPGEFKRNCFGLKIFYASLNSPLGYCQIAASHRGICHLGLAKEKDDTTFIELLASYYAKANFSQDQQKLEKYIDKLFPSVVSSELGRFNLSIKGTNMQINVWKALLTMAKDSEEAHQQSSTLELNSKDKLTAQKSKIVDILIPCHRVVRELVCCVT